MSDFYHHESSIVDSGASIGAGSRIWHFCHISTGAVLGDKCILGQNVFVGRNVSIGNGCKIQNNVSVYEGVTLEDEVFCGPSCVFTNVTTPRAGVERKEEFGRTLVKNGASLGANSTIVCGVTIGAYALIGAGSVVTKDVPDHALIVGVPGKQVGWACSCGNVLRFKSDQKSTECERCSNKYAVADSGNRLEQV